MSQREFDFYRVYFLRFCTSYQPWFSKYLIELIEALFSTNAKKKNLVSKRGFHFYCRTAFTKSVKSCIPVALIFRQGHSCFTKTSCCRSEIFMCRKLIGEMFLNYVYIKNKINKMQKIRSLLDASLDARNLMTGNQVHLIDCDSNQVLPVFLLLFTWSLGHTILLSSAEECNKTNRFVKLWLRKNISIISIIIRCLNETIL